MKTKEFVTKYMPFISAARVIFSDSRKALKVEKISDILYQFNEEDGDFSMYLPDDYTLQVEGSLSLNGGNISMIIPSCMQKFEFEII